MRKFQEEYQDTISRLFYDEVTMMGQQVRDLNPMSSRNVTFQVTDACNLACTYCYQINKNTHVMSIDVAKRFIDMILDCDDNTALYLDSKNAPSVILEFIGGEPLLQIELIDDIITYFLEQCILRDHHWATRYKISICSNGVLYFDPKVQQFFKKHKNHLSFSISVDGNKKLHDACRVFPDGRGSYDIAIAGVKHWMEVYGSDMGSKMTLAPENIMHTAEAVKSLLETGYNDINLNCVYEKGWTEEHAKIFYNQLKELSDYIFENNYDSHYVSIYQEHFFHPKTLDDT